MIKPPVVYAIGTMRALGLRIKDRLALQTPCDDMGQLPVLPAHRGRLGGRPRLAQHQHRAAPVRARQPAAHLKYATLPTKAPEDEPARRPTQAFERAHAAVGKPWLAKGTSQLAAVLRGARPGGLLNDRIARQRVLRAFMLGGPDAQVM